MQMRIKPSPRVIYDHNPLAEVLCQVRFDRILQLQTAVPDEFQTRISDRYPRLATEQLASFQLVVGPSGVQPPASVAPDHASIPAIYHFSSEDGLRKVSVSADFFTFSCTKYLRWESFKADFIEVLNILISIYPHTVIQRVGLRYKDLIERESVGLDGVAWRELLSPIVAGVFAADDFFAEPLPESGDDLIQQATQSVIRLEECNLLLQSAILRSSDASPKHAFLIDSDFFHDAQSDSVDKDNLSDLLDVLHKNADALFRACIKDKLHDALGPRPLAL